MVTDATCGHFIGNTGDTTSATEIFSDTDLEKHLGRLENATYAHMLFKQVKLMGNLPTVDISMYEIQFRQIMLHRVYYTIEKLYISYTSNTFLPGELLCVEEG